MFSPEAAKQAHKRDFLEPYGKVCIIAFPDPINTQAYGLPR